MRDQDLQPGTSDDDRSRDGAADAGSGRQAAAPKRRRGWRRIAMDIGIALVIFAAITAWQGRHLVSSGEAAPAFSLQDLDGVTHRLDELQGRKVLLYFWAPWCGVCKAVTPNVASIAASSGESVAVLPVAMAWQSREEVERTARAHGIEGPVLLGDDALAEAYSIRAYPTLYILDAKGKVRHSSIGYTTWLGLKLRLL